MDWAVGELHTAGHTSQEMKDALVGGTHSQGRIGCARAKCCRRRAAHSVGRQQRLRESILEGRGLAGKISTVVTNPASFATSGRLCIKPHQPTSLPHNCPNCPPNLCKGAVLEGWLSDVNPARVVYIGDGGGDFCPATRLREGDYLLARKPPRRIAALVQALSRASALPDHRMGRPVRSSGEALAEGMRAALGHEEGGGGEDGR